MLTELLVVGAGAEVARGSWSGGRRRLVLTLGGRSARVDVFGRTGARLALDERSRAGLLAWLVNRWGVRRLAVRPGLLAERDVAAIRRAWHLDRLVA